MLSAIIVAAGSSERMGFDKLFALVSGKPVVAHTIAAFENTKCVDEIIVVGRADSLGELQKVIGKPTKVKQIIAGGADRSDSVRAGLEHVDPKSGFVAVHDAARPMITPEKILRVFEVARTNGAATLAEPINDTLKRADLTGVADSAEEPGDLIIKEPLDRAGVYAMQTPQVFEKKLLEQAYELTLWRPYLDWDEVAGVPGFEPADIPRLQAAGAVLVLPDHATWKRPGCGL